MSPLRVLMNLLFLGPTSGGVGRYACELTGALAVRDDVDVHVVTTQDGAATVRGEAWGGDVRTTVAPIGRDDRRRYIAAVYGMAPALAAARRADVLHSPANVAPIVVPGAASVVTVHDLIWSLAGDQWGEPHEVETMRRATDACIRRVDGIIAISQWTRQSIVDAYGIDDDRIRVVQSGVRVDHAASAPGASIDEHFDLHDRRVVLCVAQKRPYKRHDVLIRALRRLPSDVVLVLPGAPTPHETMLRGLADRLGVGDRVRFPAWISDADLEALYRRATCCAFPSEYEGFGLPVLEAMARGIPVMCADRAALPEAAGDAALVVDPDDDDVVVEALRLILDDRALRDRLIAAGRVRAAAFSWGRTAEGTVDAYRAACSRR